MLQSKAQTCEGKGSRGKPMRPEQTMAEMAEEVLSRQARAQAQRTGQSRAEAREAVIQTPAGRQLEGLRSGVHRHKGCATGKLTCCLSASASRLGILYSLACLGRPEAVLRAGA